MTPAPTSTRRRTAVLVSVGVVLVLAALATIVFVGTRGGADSAAGVSLPDESSIGAVEIDVVDLAEMRDFYAGALGLGVIEEADGRLVLGYDQPLLVLVDGADGIDDPGQAGLYHTAILYPREADLAEALSRVAQNAPESYQGAADHAVSLAFYLGDPEGNGVELYVDRPRDEWIWNDGMVQMGSAFLDPNAFIQSHLDGGPVESARVGHVHLRVGELDAARRFYSDVLGFAVTAEAEGALFYSAGGYHHHLATNVWSSAGAGMRGDTPGLSAFVVRVPEQAALDELIQRLDDAGVAYVAAERSIETADPWGNTVRVLVD